MVHVPPTATPYINLAKIDTMTNKVTLCIKIDTVNNKYDTAKQILMRKSNFFLPK